MPKISSQNTLYWLWLSLALQAGSTLAETLLSHFGNDPEAIYHATEADLNQIEALNSRSTQKKALLDKDLTRAQKILARCNDCQIFLLCPCDKQYPERLRRISQMPLVLYCKGNLPDIDALPCISVVGTRRISDYGKRMTYEIAYDLARAGAVVVSGLASGVDGVAHRGCLDAGGFTIAVLGCGIDITYPKEHIDLMLEIEQKGLVVSEYPPGTRPYPSNFPQRNRIISGLSLGCAVMEAGESSGSLITADIARKQGRDVFALPGMVGEQNSIGTNLLIQNGAIAITKAADIISEYELLYPKKLNPLAITTYRPHYRNHMPKTLGRKTTPENSLKQAKNTAKMPKEEASPKSEAVSIPPSLQGTHAEIYRAILKMGQPNQDEIIAACALGASETMVALTILEIQGYIRSLPGGRYTMI
ncbi:MAG: DNA-protecting protein DprA [Ruminococcaceae bacterium]|nr:DNA-protecting protein DprA [Oscillospiraceae bacterium]